MNKKANVKKILYIILLLSIVICSNSVSAATKVEGASDDGNNADKCKKYLGISIDADDYVRETSISTNKVKSRMVHMKCKGRCKYYIYVTNYGDLEKLSSNSTTNSASDEDEDDDGDELALPKPKKKQFTDSADFELKPGKEALVIVVSLNDKKCTTKDGKETCTYPKKIAKYKTEECTGSGNNKTCKTVTKNYKYTCNCDKDGKNCSQCDVTCPKGRYNTEDVGNSAAEVDIKGNGAALFVQNPDENGQVPNLRVRTNKDYGDACNDAYKGIHTKNSKFSITNEDELKAYITNYYSKFLSYCDSDYFAFNLKSSQIENMSNALLETFYYAKNLSSDTYAVVSDRMNFLINQVRNKYGDNHVLTKESQLKNKSLQCDYSKERKTEEEYIYVKDGGKVTARLSTGSVDVCETKCYEHLKVKYDEPQAVKAGLCFSYKVTIKSETECAIKPLFNLDAVHQLKTPCSPSPVCSNNSSHTQAGPNEDFDRCINECDGGKYSQACINSCYKKVYEGKKKNSSIITKNTNVTRETTGSSSLINKNDNSRILKLGQKDYYDDENYLKEYYNNNNNSECKTSKIIDYVHAGNNSKLTKCAEYFFEAKSLFPYGHYENIGTSENPVWQWKKESPVTNAGATNDATTNIPMQIARSSPFYIRSIEETKNMLKWLVEPTDDYKDSNSTWKKYNIDENGIKRQYSSRYHCDEVCNFYGCEAGTAMSSNKYTKTTTSDLNKLANALSKCTVSSSCKEDETVTTYDIAINTKSTNKPGGSASNQTDLNRKTMPVDTSGKNNSDIFIGEYKKEQENTHEEIHYDIYTDKDGQKLDENTTGILGFCYGKGTLPHYQTTITYPGTYLNYKTGERSYSPAGDDYYRKDRYFCTPYDDENVNEKYWAWAVKENHDLSKYPAGWSPDKWNIKANLGKENSGFGKYNWNFNFQCFYSEYNEIPDECPPTDPNYPTCKPKTDETQCNSLNSSRFCNVNFRVIDSTNIFPKANPNDTKSGTTLPFNWTEDATDNNLKNGGNELKSKGYFVNPVEYKNTLQTQSSQTDPFSGTIVYEIVLDRDAIKTLKDYIKDTENPYTAQFQDSSRYRTIGNTDLRYYTMSSVVTPYVKISSGQPGSRCSKGSCTQ